jgi:hypothetical protein
MQSCVDIIWGMGSAPLRADVENVWREKVRIARERYQFAIEQTHATAMAVGEKLYVAPDGAQATKNARVTEKDALREYRRVLRIFTELVVYGTSPPDA